MTFSVAVAVFVFLPPLLILVVYPTSLYRKISHWISPKWRLRIKTYVETVVSKMIQMELEIIDHCAAGDYLFLAFLSAC